MVGLLPASAFFRDYRHRAGLDRILNVIATVVQSPGTGEKQIAGLHLPTVQTQPADRNRHYIRRQYRITQHLLVQQVSQCFEWNFSGCHYQADVRLPCESLADR